MSILESIKAERKLSFNHWRYRILHWTFNVNAPQTDWHELPNFLYTHYCPLFHLTNLIAILSPLILLIKCCILLVRAINSVIELIPFEKLFLVFDKFKSSIKPIKVLKKVTLQDEKRKLIDYICSLGYTILFKDFWESYSKYFSILTKEEAEPIFNEYSAKLEAAIIAAKIRKDKWRDRIIFWTNFSRVLLSGA